MNTALKIITTMALPFIIHGVHAGDKPSIEDLDSQYRQKLLAKVKDSKVASPQDIPLIALKVAKEVFTKNPSLLSAEAKRLLKELPILKQDTLAQYPTKRAALDIGKLIQKDTQLNEDLFLAYGWQPKRVALFAKQIALSKSLSMTELAKRNILARFMADQCYLLEGVETITIAIKSQGELILVEIRANHFGVFIPQSVTWLIQADSEQNVPAKAGQ